ILHGETVAKRACDRHPEARARRGNAQVAAGGDRKPPADGKALDHGEGRHRQRFDGVEIGAHFLLVSQAVIPATECLKLCNVSPRNEGLAACAAEHSRAHSVLAGDARAGAMRETSTRAGTYKRAFFIRKFSTSLRKRLLTTSVADRISDFNP